MVQLPSHLLDGVAEKLFKRYEMGMNPDAIGTIFRFMFTSSRCKDSVLRQFAKMKEVVFSKLNPTGPLLVEFNREDSRQAEREDRYPMPFHVGGWFVRYLIEYGQLRVRRITITGGVVKAARPGQLSQMRTIDILSELLGFEDEDPGLSLYQEDDLQLDSFMVVVGESLSKLGDNYDRFIALNPKELVINLQWFHSPASMMKIAPKSLCCTRVETVRVMTYGKYHRDSWCAFLRHLAAACPKLRLVDAQFYIGVLDRRDRWGVWVDKAEMAVRTLRDEVYPALASMTAVDTMLKFDVCGTLLRDEMDVERLTVQELLASDHPLLRLGEIQRTYDPRAISCSLKVERPEGVPWQISFRIDEVGEEEEDEFGPDYGYNSDDNDESDEDGGGDHHDCYSD